MVILRLFIFNLYELFHMWREHLSEPIGVGRAVMEAVFGFLLWVRLGHGGCVRAMTALRPGADLDAGCLGVSHAPRADNRNVIVLL
jgi:hypothetical protein